MGDRTNLGEKRRTWNYRFGQYLKQLREERRLRLDQVEELSIPYQQRISPSYLSRCENGIADISLERLSILSKIYRTDIGLLVGLRRAGRCDGRHVRGTATQRDGVCREGRAEGRLRLFQGGGGAGRSRNGRRPFRKRSQGQAQYGDHARPDGQEQAGQGGGGERPGIDACGLGGPTSHDPRDRDVPSLPGQRQHGIDPARESGKQDFGNVCQGQS